MRLRLRRLKQQFTHRQRRYKNTTIFSHHHANKNMHARTGLDDCFLLFPIQLPNFFSDNAKTISNNGNKKSRRPSTWPLLCLFLIACTAWAYQLKKTKEASTQYKKGILLYEQGQTDEALKTFNQAITLDPKHAQAYVNRGLLLLQSNHIDVALVDFNQAIKLNPQSAEAYNNRGILFYALNKKETALSDFTQAIMINPRAEKPYNNRGILLHELNQKEAALADFNKAIELNPEYTAAYLNRGKVLYDLQRRKEALADFKQVRALEAQHQPPCPQNISINRL